jgi:hypothetical protein
MNAPLRFAETTASTGTLHLFVAFHLNLAFSSIEEDQRGEVIRRCYWPLLDLACKHGPIGIEITGFTLEEIFLRDPDWIGRLRALIARGRVELIGSGYAQIIGPLVPARVTQENLRLGNEIYRHLLRSEPTLALVNEQAYSAGLVALYREAGYDALLMDWDNPGVLHPDWPSETRYLPQRAVGTDGEIVDLLWTSTVAFQQLQRFVHGDIALDEYLEHVRSRRGANARALCVYASDGEIFDFRPGRYRTEETLSNTGEWARLNEAFAALHDEPNMRLVLPSEALELDDLAGAGQALHLQSASCPVPVKKQRKYNLSRWAVTGRDDIAVNAACERIYEKLIARNADGAAWKELCGLWASDFRTHITEKRWSKFCERLRAAEAKYCDPHPLARCASDLPHTGEAGQSRFIEIKTPTLSARLDRRRGMAIESLHFASHEHPCVGGLPHGHFDDIALQADWYTGDCVFEAPGEHKITDLEWCAPQIATRENGDVIVSARIKTPKGAIEKMLRFLASEPRVEFDIAFDWEDWGRGSLRLGHVTLLPDAFDWSKLSLTTHNGGKEPETFSLNGETVEHGAPVSFLVSSSFGIGMTEGWAELGDTKTRIRVDIDRKTAPLLGLLTHKQIGGSLFCQLMLSALELDETRKPSPYREGPRRFRFGISAAAKSTDR